MNKTNTKSENKEIEKLLQICKETQMKDPEKCLTTGKKILEIALKSKDLENEGIAYKAIGLGLMNQKKYDEAIVSFNKIVSREKDFCKFNYFIPFHNAIGHCYWRKGDKDTALEFFKQALELNIKKDNKTEIAKEQVNLGALYLRMGDYEKSIEYNKKALKYFKKMKNDQGTGFAYGNLGNCYHYLGKYEKGIDYNLKAISYAKKLNDLPFLGKRLLANSSLYQKSGKFKKAVECALESLKIKEKLNENPVNVLISLGIIYKEWNNSKKAMKYYQEALKICEQEKDEIKTSMILNNIGNIYMEKKENSGALLYFQKALKIFKKLKDKHEMMIVLNNIGLIYSESEKDYEVAEKFLNESIRLAEELKLDEKTILFSLSLTNLFIKQNQFEKAKYVLEKSSSYLKNVQSYGLELSYFETQINFYKKQKKYAKAFYWLNRFSERKDKIFNEESQKKIVEMQTIYETEKKEQEAEIYRLKTIELEKKNKLIRKQKDELKNTVKMLRRSELMFNIIEDDFRKNVGLELKGESPAIKNIIDLIAVVGKSNNTNVLIMGESGTGKEIVARQIHQCSNRKSNSFFAVNSSAIPESLFESQFFGHEKNAFTGADKIHIGWFEKSDEGTLFLDEIGTMQLDRQVKLLRVIEEKKVTRLGAHKEIPIDSRIICATNENLYELVEKKIFREDLYHRLSTIVIQLPPLRERKEDIPILLEHFIKLFSNILNKKINKVEKSIEQSLHNYHFPGNVRELKNIVERAVIITESSTLKLKHFIIPQSNTKAEPLVIPLHEMEKQMIIKALQATNYHINRAAELLQVERRVVSRKMQKYNIPNIKKNN